MKKEMKMKKAIIIVLLLLLACALLAQENESSSWRPITSYSWTQKNMFNSHSPEGGTYSVGLKKSNVAIIALELYAASIPEIGISLKKDFPIDPESPNGTKMVIGGIISLVKRGNNYRGYLSPVIGTKVPFAKKDRKNCSVYLKIDVGMSYSPKFGGGSFIKIGLQLEP